MSSKSLTIGTARGVGAVWLFMSPGLLCLCWGFLEAMLKGNVGEMRRFGGIVTKKCNYCICMLVSDAYLNLPRRSLYAEG